MTPDTKPTTRLFPLTDTLESDEWYTPPYIFDALGLEFFLDPCSPPGGVPWIPALAWFAADDDGLSREWRGRVWLNPPYSQPWVWLDRLVEHGDGIALVPADTANRGFQRSGPEADVACFLRDRVQFVKLDNDNKTSARFPSVLLAYGPENAQAVIDSKLGWSVNGVRSI